MHKEQMQFAARWVRAHPKIESVLEFGALDINGSLRSLFSHVRYVGVDIGPGRGVDVIARAHEYRGEPADCVLSCEMLEHDRHWRQSLAAMPRFVAAGGLIVITCAGPERAEHGTARTSPSDAPYCQDYYRNLSQEDLLSVFPCREFEILHIGYARKMRDLQFCARRP